MSRGLIVEGLITPAEHIMHPLQQQSAATHWW